MEYPDPGIPVQTFQEDRSIGVFMKIIGKHLDAVIEILLDTHGDDRGYFEEIYSEKAFAKLGLDFHFVQDNCSFSLKKGTVRGLHWQNPPMEQSKLIRCTKGRMIDVAVDVRKGSPTFGQAVMIELCEHDHKLVLIPAGFAHGVCTLEDGTGYNYKVEHLYSAADEAALAYDDPTVNIDWQGILGMEPITSEKDKHNPTLDNINSKFVYQEVKK